MPARINDPPNMALTILLRNSPLPTIIGDLEFIAAIGPGPAAIVRLALLEVSGQGAHTHALECGFGDVVVAPVLAGVETAGGGGRHAQGGRGEEDGGEMHFFGIEDVGYW